MAEALDRLEESIELLREAGLTGVVLHWAGSVPFALGCLFYWQSLARPYSGEGAAAPGALGLTLLLVWMNTWRAVFSIRLRRLAGGEEAPRWTPGLVFRMAQNQAAFGGAKVVMLPLAALLILPAQYVSAFFRSASAYSSLPLAEAAGRAGAAARYGKRENWVAIGILSVFAIAVFLNAGVSLFLLPQILLMLTGLETSFTVLGATLLGEPMLYLSAAALTWLAMDPLVQAYHVLRCFHAESQRSGEDLRARLRTIAKAGRAAAMVALVCVVTAPAMAQPDARELERAVQETLASGEYGWQHPRQEEESSWLGNFGERLAAQMRWMRDVVNGWLDALKQWLKRREPGTGGESEPAGQFALWSVLALIAVIVVAIVLAAWRMGIGRKAGVGAAPAGSVPIDLKDERLTADRLAEDEWFALAQERLGEGEYREALRALYLGNLAWLHSRELVALDPGKTNREYERELRRRARNSPEAPALFRQNLSVFERCWYGEHLAGPEEIEQFRRQALRMKEVLPA